MNSLEDWLLLNLLAGYSTASEWYISESTITPKDSKGQEDN